MANLVVHFEIHASEPQKLIDYYSELLGWTFQEYGGGDQPYWVIDTGEGSIGNAAAREGLGINGGLLPRQGARPEVGAPVNGCNIVVGVDERQVGARGQSGRPVPERGHAQARQVRDAGAGLARDRR